MRHTPKRRLRRNRPNHKRACKFIRRSLPLSLVTRCRCRPRNRPPRLDGSLFLSPLTTKHIRWTRGRIRAHAFFAYSRLFGFGRGVNLPRRPYVGLTRSTLDNFCDGTKDFLKLSWLFSTSHCIDHSVNAQVCVNRLNALRGTYGGTYGQKNDAPHIDIPLDPKSLILIWDTGASYGLTPFRSDFIDYVECTIPVRDVTKVNTVIGIGTTLYTNLPILQDYRFIFPVCLITCLKLTSVCSPPKHITKCMVVIPKFIMTVSKCC